jgi:hypothetical protein
MAELTRIALTKHETPVSRIVAIALRMLKRQSPKLRLIVSMADSGQEHIGAIYQAGNWIFAGTSQGIETLSQGEWVHHRTATARGITAGLPHRPMLPKYRYLMPLDDEMRKRLEPLRQPYPKRAGSIDSDAPAVPSRIEGGATPTPALHANEQLPALVAI